MWEFFRIEQKKESALVDYLASQKIGLSFYASPYSLNIFLNNANKKLFLAVSKNEKRLVLLREKLFGNDIRILFEAKDRDTGLIDAIKSNFEPAYLAYNLLEKKDLKYPIKSERYELIIDTAAVAGMLDPKVARAHRVFERRHPSVAFEAFSSKHRNGISDFFDAWDARPVGKIRTRGMANDRFFLENYFNDPKVTGLVALDGNRVIGYSVVVPDYTGQNGIGLIFKCLRGYAQLGVGLRIGWARQALQAGFSKVAIGEFDHNEKGCFKMRFALHGEIKGRFGYEVYRSPAVEFRGDYLRSIL